jgi:NHL repeat-containing protein
VTRRFLVTLGLMLAAAAPLGARTFERVPLAPALGVETLDRAVTRERLGRDLFANPYAAATIARVDLYDVFPYVESRSFQIVSDSRWNRLIYGEAGRSLRAYDGRGSALGPLSEPRGLAVDEGNRLYVADTGNDRVVVLEAVTELDEIELRPVHVIGGLLRPFDVAYSDGGTPFRPGDDVLYVAETGRNRVVAFALEAGGARPIAALGELGSGPGRFAGPTAIASGRSAGASTADVYVADAHSRRIVRLRLEQGALRWIAERKHDADIVTSLDTDHWGNLYAAAPNRGTVSKWNADLVPVAELRGDLERPRTFEVPFVSVRDHRDGSMVRAGRASAISLEQWSDRGGAKLWSLGLEVLDLAVANEDVPTARFTLTDPADVRLEIVELGGARAVRRSIGRLGAGPHAVALRPEDLPTAHGGQLLLRVVAASSYHDGPAAAASTAFRADGAAVAPPARAMLLANTPNPAPASTRIAFVLPGGSAAAAARLRVFDCLGRVIRSFERRFSPGFNEVEWNGADDRGHAAAPGVYFYRLDVGDEALTRSLVLVR